MLHRLALEENERSESETASSISISSDIEKMDINDRTPSMSSVFNNGNGSQPTSPTGSFGSGSSKPNFPFHFRKNSSSSSDSEKKKEDHLVRWLRDGTVIYKSVGLGLMDLVVGMHLVEVAREKGVGTQINGF